MEYAKAGIDTAQLHGDEPPELAEKLSLSGKLEVWKAIKPESKEDIEKYKDYPADKFLIDAFSAEAHGGTGKKADWELAKLAVDTLKAPVLLAGGINSQNAKEALDKVSPFGLDLSSGVEKSPGIKDHGLVNEFFEKIQELAPANKNFKLLVQFALSALAALMLGAAGASFINEQSMFFFKLPSRQAFSTKETTDQWLKALQNNDADRAILLARKMAQRDEITLPEYDYLNIFKTAGINSQALTDGFNKFDYLRWKDAFKIKELSKSLVKSNDTAIKDIFQAINEKIKTVADSKRKTCNIMEIWNSGKGNIDDKLRVLCELARQSGWNAKLILLPKNAEKFHILCELRKNWEIIIVDFENKKILEGDSLKDIFDEKKIILYPAEFADYRPLNRKLAAFLKKSENPDLPHLDEDPLGNFQKYIKVNDIDKKTNCFNYWRNSIDSARNAPGFPPEWIKRN
jgi:hypothetical protein